MVRIWTVTGEELVSFRAHDKGDAITQVTVSSDGQLIATGSWDTIVKLWNHEGKKIQTFSGYSGTVRSISFSPDKDDLNKQILAAAYADGTVKLWNIAQSPLITLKHDRNIKSIDFIPNSPLIVTASWQPGDSNIKLWNQGKRKKI